MNKRKSRCAYSRRMSLRLPMYNCDETFDPHFGFEMIVLEEVRAHTSFVSRCWIAVILLAICSLTASLATRFMVPGPEVQKITTVTPQFSGTYRQHLLGDGSFWVSPTSIVTLFQPPPTPVLTVSQVVPSTRLASPSWHYNRPPPSTDFPFFCRPQSPVFE
jgi:hypothetical protein